MIATCRNCGMDIEAYEPGDDWSDLLAGDDGGTFDCPSSDNGHTPEGDAE